MPISRSGWSTLITRVHPVSSTRPILLLHSASQLIFDSSGEMTSARRQGVLIVYRVCQMERASISLLSGTPWKPRLKLSGEIRAISVFRSSQRWLSAWITRTHAICLFPRNVLEEHYKTLCHSSREGVLSKRSRTCPGHYRGTRGKTIDSVGLNFHL
jgi:hypothetical protein